MTGNTRHFVSARLSLYLAESGNHSGVSNPKQAFDHPAFLLLSRQALHSSSTQVRKMVRRFRTLSGCLTCRARRKKCDEIKPRCTLCSRLGICCAWGTAEEDHSPTIKVVRENLAQDHCDRKMIAHQCQTPWCDQKLEIEFEFIAQCSSWIASTLSPLALTQWRSAERLATELHDCRVAREAIDAFTADITSCESDCKQPHELQLSSKALAKVRVGVTKLANGNLNEESLPALIVSIFLLTFTEASVLNLYLAIVSMTPI